MIPRRIIQTGKTAKLSLFASAAAANLRLLNQDFEYLFFDDTGVISFINAEFPQYRSIFDSFPHRIQRYDFFRYLAVYHFGGFYFDTDVFLARGLAPLLDSSCVFPFEELALSNLLRGRFGIDWELGNYAFGAEAGHPFVEAIIANCIRAQHEPAWAMEALDGIPRPFRSQFRVLYTTGPGLVTRALAERPDLQSSVTILFPQDVGDESAWHTFGDFGVHLMQGSWRQRDGFLRTRLLRLWESQKRRKVLRQSRTVGPTRCGGWISRLPLAADFQ